MKVKNDDYFDEDLEEKPTWKDILGLIVFFLIVGIVDYWCTF